MNSTKLDQMREDFLVFGAPQIFQAEIDEVVDSMHAAWLGTGPKVAQFEQDFGRYKGSGYPVAVNSCTAALQLALISLGIGPGDEVITTPLTFCATANAIIHSGATPVLADVDPLTMNIDVDRLREQVTRRTKAVLPVHFAGRPCEMDRILEVAQEHDLRIIEDCAHAIEAEIDGRKAGTFGDVGCFSFYATKNLTTGEGGMLLTSSEDTAERARVLALHGMSSDAWGRFSDSGYRHYQVVDAGFKFNMMDLQAAIGIHQLERLEANWHRRRAIWERYQHELADVPVELPADVAAGTRHAHHLYTILVDEGACGIDRDAFLGVMTERRIGVGVHYMSLAEHPYYQRNFDFRPEATPNASRIGRTTVSLPLSARLTDDDVTDVINAVNYAVGNA